MNPAARRMKEIGPRSIDRRKYRLTTDSQHLHPVAHYDCNDFRKVLDKHQFIQSMGCKDECRDSAVAESFFGIIKSDLVRHVRLEGPQDTVKELFECIK